MTGTLLWLFLGACLTLLGLWVSAFLVAKAQKEKDRRKARLTLISHPGAQQRQVQVSAFTPSVSIQNRSFGAAAIALLKIDLQRVAHYPIPWWLVLAVGFVAAEGSQIAAHAVVGDLSYLAIPIVWVLFCRFMFGWMDRRRKEKAVLQLPDLLDQVVRAVRVGLPVLEALRVAARDAPEPTRSEFVKLIEQVSVGTSLEDAVAALALRCALPEYSFLATALSLQNQTGGALSETLIGLSEIVRKRVAIMEKGKALSSEAKATAVILTILPFATGLIMWMMNPAYMRLLVDEPMGNKMLGLAVLSLVLGLVTIRSMFQRALSLT